MKRLVLACVLVGLLGVGVSTVESKLRGLAQRNGRRRLQHDVVGTYLQGMVMIDESDRRLQQEYVLDGSQHQMHAQEIIAIEIDDGTIYELLTDNVASSGAAIADSAGLSFDIAPDNASEILSEFNSGELITIPAGNVVEGSKIVLTGPTPRAVDSIVVDKTNGGDKGSWGGLFGRDLLEEQRVQNSQVNNDQRRLKTGERSVLVVRIQAADATTGFSESDLSNSVFGTGNDEVNLRDQYLKCSHDQLTFNPATGSGVNNGVVTVDIRPETITGRDDGEIRNIVNTKLAEMFGVQRVSAHLNIIRARSYAHNFYLRDEKASDLADHVMHW